MIPKHICERVLAVAVSTGADYAELFAENTEQQAILNSPVGDVFSFDEFGNILIDYEKYAELQDTAADGQQTLKELAELISSCEIFLCSDSAPLHIAVALQIKTFVILFSLCLFISISLFLKYFCGEFFQTHIYP